MLPFYPSAERSWMSFESPTLSHLLPLRYEKVVVPELVYMLTQEDVT